MDPVCLSGDDGGFWTQGKHSIESHDVTNASLLGKNGFLLQPNDLCHGASKVSFNKKNEKQENNNLGDQQGNLSVCSLILEKTFVSTSYLSMCDDIDMK